jgi:formate/nitrite transporter FocA (FNT family)
MGKKTDLCKLIFKAVLAGALIALAGILYINCENTIIGAGLFSLGLISVVYLEAKLYTGVIGYCNSKESFADAAWILLFNILSAFLVGLIYRIGNGSISIMETIVLRSPFRVFLESIGCGFCIYLSVELYRKTKSIFPLVLGVMAFILAGFTHCVAISFYIGASFPEPIHFGYLLICIVGNSIGSLILRFLQLGGKFKDEL